MRKTVPSRTVMEVLLDSTRKIVFAYAKTYFSLSGERGILGEELSSVKKDS